MKKTVVILGAGASADYGYPLWTPLRQKIIDLDIDEFLTNEAKLSSGTEFDAHKKAYEEFCSFANSNDDDTLDQII